MPPVSFDQLSPAEREELALCGITTAEQLERCAASDLLHDWEKLKSFFPDRDPALTEARIHAICGSADAATPQDDDFDLAGTAVGTPAAQFKNKRNLREELLHQKKTEGRAPHHTHGHHSVAEKLERRHGLSKHFHAIHCSHPFRVYFGAWATLLLLVPLFALLVLPVWILTNDLEAGKPIYYGIAFALLVLPWFLIARRADCGVCHIPLFKFGNYPHNREAHHLPLLGYTMATALHIIFLFWFRCPACGTPMKIAPGSRRRKHR